MTPPFAPDHPPNPEPDPDFRFTKMLPRKSEAYTGRDFSIVCMVNDYRAPVRWFKGDQELPENKFERFLVTKDFVGNCKLTIIEPRREDSAVYKCVIDNTTSVTKGSVKFEGSAEEKKRGLALRSPEGEREGGLSWKKDHICCLSSLACVLFFLSLLLLLQ